MFRTLLASTSAIAILFGAGSAFAADAVFVDDPQPAAPVVEESRFSLTLGVGGGFQPLYEGSDEYRAYAFPIVAPSFGASDGPRRFEFRSLDDIRLHALRFDGLSVGPLLGYRFGREEGDSSRLTGLGDIDGGLVVGGFVNYDFYDDGNNRFGASAAFATQVTGDAFEEDRFAGIPNFRTFDSNDEYGYEVDLSAHYDVELNERLTMGLRAGGVYADDEYMSTNFGITTLQAGNAATLGNPLPAYDADAGIKNVYAQVTAKYQVTDAFDVRAGVNYSRLLGDAADSPVTESENQFGGFVGAAYKLTF